MKFIEKLQGLRTLEPLFVVALLVLPGCVDVRPEESRCTWPDAVGVVGPVVGETEGGDTVVSRAPGGPLHVPYWATNVGNAPGRLWHAGLTTERPIGDSGASFDSLPSRNTTYHPGSSEDLMVGETAFGSIELDPETTIHPASWRVSTEVAFRNPTCAASDGTGVSFKPDQPSQGATVRPGMGVLLHAAGFASDGTLFYSNIDRVHNLTDGVGSGKGFEMTRVPGYDFQGGSPLKVYVYNQSGDEMPNRYRDAGFVTIDPALNRALQGMQTTQNKVIHIPKEEAPTRLGDHPLPVRGVDHFFYLETPSVVAVPCVVPPLPACPGDR